MKKIVAIIFLCNSLFVHAAADQQKWDGSHYAAHSMPQYKTATSYLQEKLADLRYFPTIVDIGCGSGDITAYIAEHAPASSVVGIDLSPSMIAQAQERHAALKNLSFQVMDAQDFTVDYPCSLIVSFATFHWVANQRKALQLIAQALEPNGHVHILMSGKPESAVAAYESTLKRTQWQHLVQSDETPCVAYFQDATTLRAMAEESGLHVLEIVEQMNERSFSDRTTLEKWVQGFMGGVPLIAQLSPEDFQKFSQDYIEEYLQYAPQDADGNVTYNIPSVRMHAQKR